MLRTFAVLTVILSLLPGAVSAAGGSSSPRRITYPAALSYITELTEAVVLPEETAVNGETGNHGVPFPDVLIENTGVPMLEAVIEDTGIPLLAPIFTDDGSAAAKVVVTVE